MFVFLRIVAAVAADHVDVELRRDLVERHDRIVRHVARPVQPGFLARVPDEQQRALRLRSGARTPCAIAIIATVPDPSSSAPLLMMSPGARRVARLADAAARRVAADQPPPRLARQRRLIADVVVVGAERDVGVLQLRIRAWNDADDVARQAGPDDVVVGVDVDRDRDALQRKGGQRLLACRRALRSAYFTSDPLKRNSKNSSCAVERGERSAGRSRCTVVKSPLSAWPKPPRGCRLRSVPPAGGAAGVPVAVRTRRAERWRSRWRRVPAPPRPPRPRPKPGGPITAIAPLSIALLRASRQQPVRALRHRLGAIGPR